MSQLGQDSNVLYQIQKFQISIFLQSGGSVGSIVVVVGATVVSTGFASGGLNSHSSIWRNSTSSMATYPFELFVRSTTNSNYKLF